MPVRRLACLHVFAPRIAKALISRRVALTQHVPTEKVPGTVGIETGCGTSILTVEIPLDTVENSGTGCGNQYSMMYVRKPLPQNSGHF